MSSLDGAFTLTKMDHIAKVVRQDLKFYMPWVRQVFFYIDVANAEGISGDRTRGFEGLEQLFFIGDDGHPDAAPASRGLHDHGKVDLPGYMSRSIEFPHAFIRTGHHGNAGLDHLPSSCDFIAHHFEDPSGRPDECYSRFAAGRSKCGVFRKKAVARMNRIRIDLHGGPNNLADVEITLRRGRRPNATGLIGISRKKSITVGLRIHRGRSYSEFATGPHYADSYFTTVGYQNFFNHLSCTTMSTSSGFTISPSLARICLTTPP